MPVDRSDRTDGLKFHDDRIFHHKIQAVPALNSDAVIEHGKQHLTEDV